MAKGSVRKRGKKWYYRFYVETEGGKRIQKEFAGTGSKSETEALLRKAMKDYESSRYIARAKGITVGDLLNMWVEEELKPGGLSNGTVSAYQCTARRIRLAPIGVCRLQSVAPEQLQAFFDDLSLGGRKPDGSLAKPLAAGSIRPYAAVMKAAFRFAVFPKRFIHDNPMQHVRIRQKREQRSLFQEELPGALSAPVISREQWKDLTAYLDRKGSPALLPVQIAYYTGLRIGEVCALTWQDIDLKEQTITVRHSMRYNESRHRTEIGSAKRNKIRTVDFCATLAGLFRTCRERQLENHFRLGNLYCRNYYRRVEERSRSYYELYSLPACQDVPAELKPIDFVCLKADGSFESASHVSIACRDAARHLPALSGFHFHQLRHTYTSNLLRGGAAPKDVQELLGHTDISTTMNIYAHACRETKRSLSRMLDQVVGERE